MLNGRYDAVFPFEDSRILSFGDLPRRSPTAIPRSAAIWLLEEPDRPDRH